MTHSAPSFASLLVAVGGGTGAFLRYQVGHAIARHAPVAASTFPYATLAVNVLGSLMMGMLAGWMARHGGEGRILPESWRLLLGVGLLGGFTTFSSFSLELVLLWQRGAAVAAIVYAVVSLAAGVAGLFTGLAIMRIAA